MKKLHFSVCLLMLSAILLLAACSKEVEDKKDSEPAAEVSTAASAETTVEEKEAMVRTMTMEEARLLFEAGGDYLIVDVRRVDEFESGHIPGAINIPNETIQTEPPKELPDLDEEIYLYCRSGNRSGQAANKLLAMGYTNVINFGGIMDWTGRIEK